MLSNSLFMFHIILLISFTTLYMVFRIKKIHNKIICCQFICLIDSLRLYILHIVPTFNCAAVFYMITICLSLCFHASTWAIFRAVRTMGMVYGSVVSIRDFRSGDLSEISSISVHENMCSFLGRPKRGDSSVWAQNTHGNTVIMCYVYIMSL